MHQRSCPEPAQLESSWQLFLVKIRTRCASKSTAMLHGLASMFLAGSRSWGLAQRKATFGATGAQLLAANVQV